MLLSAEQLFSDSQALTATAASTNIIDLGATGTVLNAPAALTRDIGKGKPIPIIVQIEGASGGTNETLDVAVQVDTTSAFSSATTVATATQIGAVTAATEVYLDVYLPEGTDERYLRLNYTLSGTSPTYTVSAGIVAAKNSNKTVPGA